MNNKKHKEKWDQIDDAMYNTYLLLTKRVKVKDIIKNQEEFIMSFHKNDECNIDETIDNLIDHFISTEEYEICAELVKIKNEEKEELSHILEDEKNKKKRNTQ